MWEIKSWVLSQPLAGYPRIKVGTMAIDGDIENVKIDWEDGEKGKVR